MNNQSALNYVSYLALDQVLTAQHPQSDIDGSFEHDEMLFIIIHQVYELWFKQLLHEIDYLIKSLHEGKTTQAIHTFRRILTILKTIVSQIDILETMTPLEFLSFRDFLGRSSGFQSVQFREVEFVLGHKREQMMAHFSADVFGQERLAVRFQQPTLWDAFLRYVHDSGFEIPADQLERDVTQSIASSAAVQIALINAYRANTPAARIAERMVDLDEGLQEWRYRHVKMVERTIGSKPGTGGSAGAKYLATTLQPLYPDLWAIRGQL